MPAKGFHTGFIGRMPGWIFIPSMMMLYFIGASELAGMFQATSPTTMPIIRPLTIVGTSPEGSFSTDVWQNWPLVGLVMVAAAVVPSMLLVWRFHRHKAVRVSWAIGAAIVAITYCYGLIHFRHEIADDGFRYFIDKQRGRLEFFGLMGCVFPLISLVVAAPLKLLDSQRHPTL